MKKKILWVCVLFILFALPSFSLADVQKGFASFDQAFIPPLAITKQEKLKPSQKAMKLLKKNWAIFEAQYSGAKPDDAEWKNDFKAVDEMIKEADRIVNSGKNLEEAHETLEGVRTTFMALRKRNNIDYYLDYLTVFHAHMEAIFHTGEGNTAEDLNDEDVHDLKGILEEAFGSWDAVRNASFNAELYDFGPEKIKKKAELIQLETEALNKLKKALEKNDKDMIIKTAKGVRPNYAELYKLFGDFESIKK